MEFRQKNTIYCVFHAVELLNYGEYQYLSISVWQNIVSRKIRAHGKAAFPFKEDKRKGICVL